VAGALALAWAVHLVAAIATDEVLFRDGVHYLLSVMRVQAPRLWDPARSLANLATQLPVVLAIRLGVRDIGWLAHLLGAGLFLPELLSMAVCFWCVRGRRTEMMLFPLLSQWAFAASSSFTVVGESHLMHSLFWVLLFLILFKRPWGWRSAALTLVLAGLTLRTYQSMVAVGPVLTLAALMRAREERAERGGSWPWIALSCWFVAGASLAAFYIAHPPDPASLVSFRGSLAALADVSRGHAHLTLVFSLVSVGWIATLAAVPVSATAFRVVSTVLAATGAVIVIAVGSDPELLAVGTHYPARVFTALAPAVLGCVVIAISSDRLTLRPESWPRSFAIVALLATVQLGWHLAATAQWWRTTTTLRDELAVRAGFVPFALLARERPELTTGMLREMDWAVPSFSIALAERGEVRAIVGAPRPGWQPFDPTLPATLPQLLRYGISYERYARALAAAEQTREQP
jgi:hypothetical protein